MRLQQSRSSPSLKAAPEHLGFPIKALNVGVLGRLARLDILHRDPVLVGPGNQRSALLPYYRTEPATERVQAMLQHLRAPALISVLTAVEVANALPRWVRGGEITGNESQRISAAFKEDINEGAF